MNPDRKKIIIQEILYWRESKLLPESYCNYLLTLYTEGDIDQIPIHSSVKGKIPTLLIFLIYLLLLFFFLVIYFTEISPILQMEINFVFLIVSIFIGALRRRNNFILHCCFIFSALFFLLLTVKLCDTFFTSTVFLMVTLLVNCIGWGFIGFKTQKTYFIVAGILGGLVVIFSFFF